MTRTVANAEAKCVLGSLGFLYCSACTAVLPVILICVADFGIADVFDSAAIAMAATAIFKEIESGNITGVKRTVAVFPSVISAVRTKVRLGIRF